MIACISIPYFAAAVERRAATGLADTPLAIGGQPWEARPIFAFSQEVARLGVRAGMSLRLAHVLSPQACFLPATRSRYRQASGEIVDVLLDYSPAVEPQELWHPFADRSVQFTVDGRTLPVRYFLDLDDLPVPESLELARALGRFLRGEMHFAPVIGLAASRFAAQVAATVGRPNHAKLVEPGGDAAFLAPRSVDFLPLDGETLRRLHLLGINTLGGLARLSRSAIISQFGPAIDPLHRLARGRPARQPSTPPQAAPRRESATHRFEPAVADGLVLSAVVRRLAADVSTRLAVDAVAAGSVYLDWETEDGRRDRRAITLRRPTADPAHLSRIWLDMLAAVVADLSGEAEGESPAGLVRLSLGSCELSPVVARQMTLFDDTGARDLQATWAGLRALMERHGPDLFLRPATAETDHPLPERRFRWFTVSDETPYDAPLA